MILIFSQILTDEINTLQLELDQISERNGILSRDNAKLLQRWLDAKQIEANKVNEANDFYEDMRSRHQAVLNWRDKNSVAPSASNASADDHGSGNGATNGDRRTSQMKDGKKSPPGLATNLSPNG